MESQQKDFNQKTDMVSFVSQMTVAVLWKRRKVKKVNLIKGEAPEMLGAETIRMNGFIFFKM